MSRAPSGWRPAPRGRRAARPPRAERAAARRAGLPRAEAGRRARHGTPGGPNSRAATVRRGVAADRGVEALAALNADRPGLLGAGPLTAPYAVRAGDTLASVAAAFPTASLEQPQDLGVVNADVPGLFAPGGSLLLATREYTVQPGDTFASIAQAQAGDVAAVGAANADRPVLAPGRRLAVPRHVVFGGEVTATVVVAGGDTLGGLAHGHALDVGLLAAVNADVVGVLPAGTPLRYLASTGTTYTTTTRDADTISTVGTRLQGALLADAAPGHVTPARLGAANPDAPLAVGARLLLPPPDVVLDVPLTVQRDAALVGVDVSLTLARSGSVDPALAHAGRCRRRDRLTPAGSTRCRPT